MTANSATATPFGPAMRVLLVDEDPISRHVLAEAFDRDMHFDLVAAVGPSDDAVSAPIDVAVLCIVPTADVLRRVSELTSLDVKVLMVGANWAGTDVVRAFGAGALGCVLKTFRVADILSATLSAGTGHMVLSPELRVYYPPSPFTEEFLAGIGDGTATNTATDTVANSAEHPLLDRLTSRELEVLEALAGGRTTAEVALHLGVSKATVKSHVSHALTKLGARNRVEAVLMVRGSEVDGATTC